MSSRRTLSSILLAAALLMLVCLSAGAAPKLIRLTFYYPVGVSGPLATVINKYVEEFNTANPDIEVIPVYTGDYDPTMQKVQTAVMGGNPPDVFIVEISELPTLLAMNACEPLDKWVSKEYLADFFPAFLQNSYSEDGRIWGIPFQRSTPVFYWNKAAFKEAGLDPNVPPRNWRELEDYAKKLVKADAATGEVKRWGVTISGGWNDWLFEAFVIQNGSSLLDYINHKVTLNSPEAVEALEFWVRLTQELKVAPPHSTWASTPTDFVSGRTAMLYHSTGILTFVRTSAPFEYGVAFMPAKKSYGAAVGGGNLHIARGIPDERKQAAWKFVQFLTTPEMAARWSRDSGYVATRQSSYELTEMKQHLAKYPEYAVAREQLAYARGKMMSPVFQKIREIVKTALDEATGGKITPQKSLERAQQQAERLLGNWVVK
ncbi:MAG: ABC transporter substrate-binding protein [Firmicutes bacterium]|nr:ABC transporter substrate-binding protein [Bacillota bacterium]